MAQTTKTKAAKANTQYAICFDSRTGAIHTQECNHYRRYVAAGSKWSAWRSPFAGITDAEAEIKKEEKAVYYCRACKPTKRPAAVAPKVQEEPKAKPRKTAAKT